MKNQEIKTMIINDEPTMDLKQKLAQWKGY